MPPEACDLVVRSHVSTLYKSNHKYDAGDWVSQSFDLVGAGHVPPLSVEITWIAQRRPMGRPYNGNPVRAPAAAGAFRARRRKRARAGVWDETGSDV
jgi:hypothetical protein